ncbi:MAG TPA: sulfatase-like hydrolase/transferase [Pirellulales bacterium]|nr:sulfatase-like hydrolase/transferase [Pirellulales bacterium]
MIRFRFRLLAVWLAALCGAATADGADARPNVLLLVSDDQRPNTIGALGNDHIHTPHIDALVKRGTVFTRAVAPNPICTPSRAELISGCTGFRNGVLDFGKRLAADLTLWPQAMRAAGYHTWHVGKWDLGGQPTGHGYEATDGLFTGGSRLAQSFPHDFAGRDTTGYRGWVFRTDEGQPLPERGVGLTPDISRRFADAAIRLLKRKSDRPFFLHVNFTAPHDPLLIPPGKAEQARPDRARLLANFLPEHPFEHGNLRGRDELLWPWPRTPDIVRAELAAYYAVIEDMDEQIGRILHALAESGEAANTLVVFTSDQGLAIGSHGLRGKQNMYEHTIGAPLVMCGPKVPAGRRIDAQCYLRDLYPTVCELANVPAPQGLDGRSLAHV